MDRLAAMRILVAAAEERSFSAASRKLRIPLPTVSRRVADLEAHLKTRLLARSPRGLVLTEAGDAYVAACRRILEEIQDAEAKAAGEYLAPRGELALTAPVVFGRLHVLPVVMAFLSRFAEIGVRLRLSDRNVSLVDDHIDMAARIGDLPDSALIATRVGEVRRVVCGSPAYLAAHGEPLAPEDLAGHACVDVSAMSSAASWEFAGRGARAKSVTPPCRLRTNTAESAIDAAIGGVGLTNVLSYQVARAVGEGKLRIVLRDFEPPPLPIHLVHAQQGALPLKMRRFLEFAAPRIRESVLATQNSLGPRDTDR
jgi:DNA-binding transcriptional LysR family regulator